jgi:hypothetical protein
MKNILTVADYREIAETILCLLLGYVLLCILFSSMAGTEYTGPYMPFWHWPIKVLRAIHGG